ncbi:hypothetical protein OB955_01165 [Halobacteria archaeon AArc-m2/3/4]|uniref:Uncharacterized protein n=1 Tax=Natronoglomus mannanivorans TaxID=2979990 RepID=A0ABT2Q8V4_9EURY|nr:hypothetical protein [Halobacteria archaeon AArc-m2/3/4]
MTPLLERVRQPEFTGSNRCWPCTVLNGMLLWIGVTVVTVLGLPFVAVGLAAVGLATIVLRGYLVPFTPRFAPQLVSLLPGDPFDHDREPGSLSDTGTPDGEDVLTALVEAGVVVPDGEEIALEPSVRRAWREEMAELRTLDIEELAAVGDAVTPDSIDARGETRWGNAYVVLDAENASLTLLPHAIAVAELAAASTLESHVDDERIRLAAGRPFRTLLEACPLCEGEVIVSTSTCCGDVTPIGSEPKEKLVCPDCSVRLFTYE